MCNGGYKTTLTKKTPVKELRTGSKPVQEIVEQTLMNDKDNAYTIGGIMIEAFGVKEKDINKSFKDWPKGLPTLYTRIRIALKKLEEQGKIKQTKQGKAVHYWWNTTK